MTDRIDDVDAYLASFDSAGDARYRCDATPWYLYSVKAAASIHDMAPGAKLVVRLRDPVDMLASLHNHHRFVGLEREPSFKKAVFTSRGPDPTDFRKSLDYLSVARLGEQVQRYVETFSPEQIYFMRFETSSRNPEGSHLGLLEWLGLDPVPLEHYERLNRARRPRIRRLRSVTDWMTEPRHPHPLRAAGYRLRRANTAHGRSSVSVQLRRRILGELRDDIELLSRLSGHDLVAAWTPDRQRSL